MSVVFERGNCLNTEFEVFYSLSVVDFITLGAMHIFGEKSRKTPYCNVISTKLINHVSLRIYIRIYILYNYNRLFYAERYLGLESTYYDKSNPFEINSSMRGFMHTKAITPLPLKLDLNNFDG